MTSTSTLPRLKHIPRRMAAIDQFDRVDGLAFVAHGARVGIQVNDPAALDRIPDYLPPGWQATRSPVVDVLYSLILGDTSLGIDNVLYRDAHRLLQTNERDEVFEQLGSHLHWSVALHARRRLFVHAGVVEWRGRAVVIPGRSLSGKTSLVEALVRAGATYNSDEYAVFDTRGLVHPYPKPLSLRQNDGARPRQCPAAALGGQTGTRPLPLGAVVMTEYQKGAIWHPRRLSPGQAVLALLDNTVLARSRHELAIETFRRAISGAFAFRTQRGEARDVIGPLMTQLDEAIDP